MKKHPQIKVPKVPIHLHFPAFNGTFGWRFGYIQTIHPPFLKVPFSSSGAGLSTSWVWDFSDVGDQIQCEQLEVCVELSSLTTCSRRMKPLKNRSVFLPFLKREAGRLGT